MMTFGSFIPVPKALSCPITCLTTYMSAFPASLSYLRGGTLSFSLFLGTFLQYLEPDGCIVMLDF